MSERLDGKKQLEEMLNRPILDFDKKLFRAEDGSSITSDFGSFLQMQSMQRQIDELEVVKKQLKHTFEELYETQQLLLKEKGKVTALTMKLQRAIRVLDSVKQKANHYIPSHAWADHEAATVFAGVLDSIYEEIYENIGTLQPDGNE